MTMGTGATESTANCEPLGQGRSTTLWVAALEWSESSTAGRTRTSTLSSNPRASHSEQQAGPSKKPHGSALAASAKTKLHRPLAPQRDRMPRNEPTQHRFDCKHSQARGDSR